MLFILSTKCRLVNLKSKISNIFFHSTKKRLTHIKTGVSLLTWGIIFYFRNYFLLFYSLAAIALMALRPEKIQ